MTIKFILRAEPLFVFLNEKEKRRFCVNRVKLLRSPQPKPLDYSILFSVVKQVYTLYQARGYKDWVRNYILATCHACSTKIILNSSRVFDDYDKIEKAKERLCWKDESNCKKRGKQYINETIRLQAVM